jgi:diguanylate cyclase (GGDEF)-like protein
MPVLLRTTLVLPASSAASRTGPTVGKMRPTATEGIGRVAAGAKRAAPILRAVIPVKMDPYLFYTATLTPIVIAVAILGRRPNDIVVAIVLSLSVVAMQGLTGIAGRRRRIRAALRWQLLRLAIPLAYVALVSHMIGGSALPLISLYVPIVAAAGAMGMRQGLITAAIAAGIFLIPQLTSLGSPEAVALRGVALAGITFVIALGTRRIVRALEEALGEARSAVVAERRRARQLEALESVGRLLAGSGPSEARIDQVVSVIVSRFRYEHVSVYLGDTDGVHLVAQRGYPDAIPAFDPSAGIAGRVMRTGRLALVPDVRADLDYLPGTIDATSLISAPLQIDGRFLGILNVETSGDRRLDHTDRTLVGILAGRVASAVALGQDRQALADQARLFGSIGNFAGAVAASLAIEPLAQTMVNAIQHVVAADLVAATLLDRTDGRYRVRAVLGADADAIGREVRAGEGMAGRAIRDRATVRDDTLSVEKSPRAVRDLDAPSLRHGLGLPLIRDGVVVGALTVGRTASTGRFTEREVEGLELVASHAALAVANAFLHAEVAESAVRDPLTGLYNRRHFDEALDRLIAAHQREQLGQPRPLSAIVFDLDRFGAVNKEHGHQVGDQVLRRFADVLRGRFRASDLVARLGGEEFIVILDGADREQAIRIADEVRGAFVDSPVVLDDATELRVTVSGGCAELDPTDASRATLPRTSRSSWRNARVEIAWSRPSRRHAH